jgi:hypothetical protein
MYSQEPTNRRWCRVAAAVHATEDPEAPSGLWSFPLTLLTGGPAFCDNSMPLAAAAVVHAAQDRAGQGPHATHLARLPCCHSHLNSFLSPSPPRCLLHPAPCSKQSATVLCTYVRGLSLSLSLSALSLDSLPTLRKKIQVDGWPFATCRLPFGMHAWRWWPRKELESQSLHAWMEPSPEQQQRGCRKEGGWVAKEMDGDQIEVQCMHACPRPRHHTRLQERCDDMPAGCSLPD